MSTTWVYGLPGDSVTKNPAAVQESRRHGFDPWVRKIPWRRAWQPTPVFLSAESREQRRLKVYGPWGGKVSGITEVNLAWHRTWVYSEDMKKTLPMFKKKLINFILIFWLIIFLFWGVWAINSYIKQRLFYFE